MNKIKRVIAALTFVALVSLTVVAPAHATEVTAPNADIQRVFDDTNAARIAQGLKPLVLDAAMSVVAQNWTNTQAASSVMSHNPSYAQQIPAGWSSAAENVAYGFTPQTVVAAWLASAGHRANILGDFTHIGVGYKNGYVTQNFGKYPTTAPATLTAAPVPIISGTLRAGSTLTVNPGAWKPAPVPLSYQWLRSGNAIAGATTSTYTLTASDVGSTITVTVTGKKSGYRHAARTSAPMTIPRSLTAAPVPVISGTLRVGSTLTVNPGAWKPAPVPLSYQWLRSGNAIAGATTSTYTLTASDVGSTITVTVTGKKSGYRHAARTSAPMTIPRSLTAAPVPVISGTLRVGSTLTVNPGAWKPAPVPLSYQWLRSGNAIAGATTSTYTLTASDVGSTITVTVTGKKSGYRHAARTSAPMAAVTR